MAIYKNLEEPQSLSQIAQNELFRKVVNSRIEAIRTLLITKGQEYSTGDRFSNFKDAANGLSFHSKPEMVAWEFATKHFQSLKDILGDKVPYDEARIKEKIGDAIIYLILIEGMLTERLNLLELKNKVHG